MTGLCECGCGQRTTISPHSDRSHGYIAGEPRRFVRGHTNEAPGYSFARRLWWKTDIQGPDDCWRWQGYLNHAGYGQIRHEGRAKLCHRVAYELMVGPIPEGLTLDHLCRNPACVNPAHLEPVTLQENLRRGEGASVQNAKKTHCSKGHPYDEENTQWYRGGRRCAACNRARAKENYWKKREAVAA